MLARVLTPRRLLYLLPPVVALLIVLAAQGQTAPLEPIAPAPGVELDRPDALADITPVGDLAPIAGVDTSDTDRRIAFWQDRLTTTPRSETSWTYLGDLFDLKGRQTGDLSNFAAAQQAYQTAVDIAPRSPEAHVGLARISLTLHDFEAAFAAGQTIYELNPGASSALAIMFDASLELGDLDTAQRQLSALADRSDSPAVLIRGARLAFVTGDSTTAVEFATRAAQDADALGESPTGIAFYSYAAGELAILAGEPEVAAGHFGAALDALPGYAPAIAGEGRAAFAMGELDVAIERLEVAVAAVPRPDFVAFLGDLYALAGRTEDAQLQYATVEFIHQLAVADGARVYDREYVTYLADHGQDAQTAIDLARQELVARRDVYGYDALAWALHNAGLNAEALDYVSQSLGQGTRDARLLIHAGLIEIAAGQSDTGQAHLDEGLALNPAFSPLTVAAAREAAKP